MRPIFIFMLQSCPKIALKPPTVAKSKPDLTLRKVSRRFWLVVGSRMSETTKLSVSRNGIASKTWSIADGSTFLCLILIE